jgi:FMN reductase
VTTLRITAIDGSPSGGGRTSGVLDAVLRGAAGAGAETRIVSLADGDVDTGALGASDAFVFGSPVYRASFATPLKALLDRLPRGMWGEAEEPLRGRAAGIVLTGASWHHYLALNELRSVLAGFFAAHVLSPGLYVPTEGFDEADKQRLTDPFEALARRQGAALVDLARAISQSSELQDVRPQA